MKFYKLTILAFFCSATCLLAAAPSNDNKANAQVLTGDTASITTTNVAATKETGDFANRTLWWKWTAGGNGSLTLDTINSTASSLSIAVYLLNNSDQVVGTVWVKSSSNIVYVTGNSSYLIGVGTTSSQTSALGSVKLSLSLNKNHIIGSLPIAHPATMANDSFAQRITLTGNIVSALCYPHSATKEAGEPAVTEGRTMWWQYRPTTNGRLSVTSTNGVQDYPQITVFMGTSINNLRVVQEDGGYGGASLSFPVTSGVDYIICYGTSSTSPYGIGVLNLSLNTQAYVSSLPTPPATMANDNISQRVTLTGDNVGAVAYNYSATTEAGEPSLSGYRTFWWTYRPSSNGMLTITDEGSDISYPIISVYLGSSMNNLKPLFYNGSLYDASLSIPVTAGTDYIIAFGTSSTGHADRIGSLVINLSLNRSTPVGLLNIPSPATMENDAFSNRTQLTGYNVSAVGYTLGATREAQEPDAEFRTVWFSWTANASGQAFVDFTGTLLDGLGGNIWTGSSLSSLTAVSLTAAGGNKIQFSAVAGTQYHLSLGEKYQNTWRSLVVTFIGPGAKPQGPIFTEHPNGSGWLSVGQTLQLTSATNDASTQFQWRQNAKNITGAKAASLSRTITAVSMAGLYDVTAKNSIGTTTSNDAVIGVMAVLPSSVSVAEGAALKLSIPANAPSKISYRWRRNGTPLADGKDGKIVTKGSSAAVLSISGMTSDQAGAYTCELSMANPVNVDSPFVALSSTSNVGIVLKPMVPDLVVPVAAVSRPFSWQLAASQSPTGFIVKGLPSGLSVNTSTGLITGTPNAVGQPKIKVSAKNAAGTGAIKEFTLNISSLPDGVTGGFSGLISRQNELNNSLGGSFTLSVTTTGTFTGTIKNGLGSYPIKGRLNAPQSASPTANVTIPRKSPLSPLTLVLTFNGGSNSVNAVLSDGSNTVTGDGRGHVWTSSSAAAYAAAYNSVVELPAGSMNDSAQPLGCGWQQMAVTSKGTVKGAGRTADGISYTFAGTLWPDGSFPQYAIIYASKSGSVTGLPKISLGATVPDNRISGWVEQIKNGPASSSDRTYRTSIPLLRRNVKGAPWIKPTKLMPVVLELPDAPDNADVAFSKGGIESTAQFANLSQVFRINKNNSTTFNSITAGNPCAVTMKITAANGSFKGSFILNDTVSGQVVKRKVSYAGILLSHTGMGYGYFTLSGLSPSIKNSDILSGRVVVD